MNIWIVNPYGNLPDEAWREYRSSMLARAFARAGHNVVWWISNIEHRSKAVRKLPSGEIRHSPSITIRVLPCAPYQHNISLRRIAYERQFGNAFSRRASQEIAPDLVVLAEPALFYGPPILTYLNACCCPLVVDVLDLWPELFQTALPLFLRPFHRILFYSLYRQRTFRFRRASAIVAVSEDYRSVARQSAPTRPSHVAYLGVDLPSFRKSLLSPDDVLQRLHLPPKSTSDVWLIYAGTLGEAYDLQTIAGAAAKLHSPDAHYRFLFAGDGPKAPMIQQLCRERSSYCTYLGKVAVTDLTSLYRHCDIGLCSYARHSTVSMPVKFYDYLAAGLAVINSLRSEVSAYVAQEVGANYTANSPLSLIDAIRHCADDPTVLAKMKATAQHLATSFDSAAQHDDAVAFILRNVAFRNKA